MENAYPTPFLILKLPYVVMKNAMRNWDPVELVIFSLVSKRSRKAVKLSTRQNSFELWSCFHWHPQIEVHVDKEIYNLIAPFANFYFIHIKNIDPLGWLKIVWTTKWTDYVSETLNCDVHLLHVDADNCIFGVPFIINWFNSRQRSIEYASFRSSGIYSDSVASFLEICKVNKSLRLELQQPREIDSFAVHFAMDTLSVLGDILATNWIKIDHIINSDCIHMHFGGFSFTETDMSRFLKAWINGCNMRMEYFSIWLKHLKHEILIDGIEVEEREINVVRIHERDIYLPVKMEGGTDIRRASDGIVATFKQEDVQNPEGKLRFTMIVWKE